MPLLPGHAVIIYGCSHLVHGGPPAGKEDGPKVVSFENFRRPGGAATNLETTVWKVLGGSFGRLSPSEPRSF